MRQTEFVSPSQPANDFPSNKVVVAAKVGARHRSVRAMIRARDFMDGQTIGIENSSVTQFVAGSSENFSDDMSMHISQTAIDAILANGQLLVIDAKQVEHGRVKVVAVGFIFRRLVSPVIAAPVGDAGLDAGAPKPRHETAAIVIAPDRALREGGAAKLSAPDDERVFFQAT